MQINSVPTLIDTVRSSILESLQEKYQLEYKGNVKNVCKLFAIAETPAGEKIIISIKNSEKNAGNESKHLAAISSNRLAREIKADFMPKIIEFDAFERGNILWTVIMSSFGGKPVSSAIFFTGSDEIISDRMIESLHQALDVIGKSAAGENLTPRKVSMLIRSTFGHRVVSEAPEWNSAHGDLHWGNILDSGVIVDWDSFTRAPKGFDAANLLLFSVSNVRLFERLHKKFADVLQTDSGRVSMLLSAALIFKYMPSEWQVHGQNIREAIMSIVSPRKMKWPRLSDIGAGYSFRAN